MVETLSFRRRYLPHWCVADRTYFVTFRLKHSIPRAVAEEWRRDREDFLKSGPSQQAILLFERRQFARMDACLDATSRTGTIASSQGAAKSGRATEAPNGLGTGQVAQALPPAHGVPETPVSDSGPMYSADPAVAALVMEGFERLARDYHWLINALVVMPNHVHVLLRNTAGQSHMLSKHLGILKGCAARDANTILCRKGDFWLSENFDHWCRGPDKIESAKRYIHNNPVKAGLAKRSEDWPWRM